MILVALGFRNIHGYSYVSVAEIWVSHLPRGSFSFLLDALYTRQSKCSGAKHSVAILRQSMNMIIMPLQLCLWLSMLMMSGFVFEFHKEGVSEQLPIIVSVKE